MSESNDTSLSNLEMETVMAVDVVEETNVPNKRKRKYAQKKNPEEHTPEYSMESIVLLKQEFKFRMVELCHRMKEVERMDERELMHASHMDFSIAQQYVPTSQDKPKDDSKK